jgi:manganese/zinc/iron transport system permease protein
VHQRPAGVWFSCQWRPDNEFETHTPVKLDHLVLAFLLTHWIKSLGWISLETYKATEHAAMFIGAIAVGVLTALLTEWVQKLGRVESTAALGVVYTTLFAAGLLLIRIAADSVHLDPDCVLYGNLELSVLDVGMTVAGMEIPRPVLVSGAVFLVNLFLIVLFFKELRISAFDPSLATTLGIHASLMHYALMGVTAATVVAAFESVGSILVIAMLIVPSATAHLLTDRLSTMIFLSLLIAALSALLGHVFALTLPPIVFGRLGFDSVRDAGTAGMMAAACGFLFVLAMLFGPRHGVLSKLFDQSRLSLKIAGEDMLGLLFRLEESTNLQNQTQATVPRLSGNVLGVGPILSRLALFKLQWGGKIAGRASEYRLTDSGRKDAKTLVRAHRLWESYMARHFDVPDDHLHETASHVEHFLDPDLRAELSAELDRPRRDPHGRDIPDDHNAGS